MLSICSKIITKFTFPCSKKLNTEFFLKAQQDLNLKNYDFFISDHWYHAYYCEIKSYMYSTIVSTLSNQNFFELQWTKASKHLSTSLYILHLISYRDRVKEFLTPHLFLIYINVSINSALSSSPLWNQTDDLLERWHRRVIFLNPRNQTKFVRSSRCCSRGKPKNTV